MKFKCDTIIRDYMLTIIYLLNNKKIKYGYIFLLGIFIFIIGYINPYLLGFFIIDIYALLSLTQFKVIKPKYNLSKESVKVYITTEGIEKEELDVKSIFLNYMSKFD